MKTKQINIKVVEFENGDILLGHHYDSYGLEFFVQIKEKSGTHIALFNEGEMLEIYNVCRTSLSLKYPFL